MKSVTQRIKEIKQPTGGYINPKFFKETKLEDQNELFEEENITPALVGLTVDYMTRYLNSNNLEKAFSISLMGAEKINESKKAYKLLENITGLDNQSIINACKLCGYDVCYRAGIAYYKNIDEINPNENTILNIKIMIQRGLNFFENYGPVVQDGLTFQGGYTSTISAGDADFITKDTLWDFKVSKSNPTKDHTLQLIIYYLLGIHSYACDFSNIKKIGIFNPRKNIVYEYEIGKIPNEIIKEIEVKVIGYGQNKQTNNNSDDILTINDIMKYMECSRHMVIKYYTEYGLPLEKEKNKYIIDRRKFWIWLEEMKRKKEEEQKRQITITLISIIIYLIILIYLFSLLS